MQQSVHEKKTEEQNLKNQVIDVKTEAVRQQLLKKLIEESKKGAIA